MSLWEMIGQQLTVQILGSVQGFILKGTRPLHHSSDSGSVNWLSLEIDGGAMILFS